MLPEIAEIKDDIANNSINIEFKKHLLKITMIILQDEINPLKKKK